MSERVILTADDVRRAMVRIAHEIVEAHRGTKDLMLLGMHTRGVPLARRLGRLIEEIEGAKVPVVSVDVTLYRDDLSTRGAAKQLTAGDLAADVTGKRVVLVDEVIFTGRSVTACATRQSRGKKCSPRAATGPTINGTASSQVPARMVLTARRLKSMPVRWRQ